MNAGAIADMVDALVRALSELPDVDRIAALNDVRTRLHEVSPFRGEPVDLVLWVPGEDVRSNGYNPNVVAPVEMDLLRHSIASDGYTQPIVSMDVDGVHEVVDGFHRSRVGREVQEIRARVLGHLPVVRINEGRRARADRMAATVRHNRARGRHQVVRMSDIVVDLTRRGWSRERIAQELGMDEDEVLRLKQVTGLADLFRDREFSAAWDVVDDS